MRRLYKEATACLLGNLDPAYADTPVLQKPFQQRGREAIISRLVAS